jgi:epoxyqueuosine reductase
MFPKSGVKRTGRERFLRNVLIAIGNSGDVTLVPDAKRLLDDPSPLIRGAAVWALSRLVGKDEFAALRREDVDAGVMEEWAMA